MKLRKLTALLCAAAISLSFAACNGAENAQTAVASGCYVESEISFGGNPPAAIFTDTDGKLSALSIVGSGYKCFDSDGNEKECGWLSGIAIDKAGVIQAFVGGDGKLYALIQEYSESLTSSLLRASDDRKTAEDVTPSMWHEVKTEDESRAIYPYISKAGVAENGSIVYNEMFGGGVTVVRNNKSEIISSSNTNSENSDFSVFGNTVYYNSDTEKTLYSYNCEDSSKKEISTIDFNTQNIKFAVTETNIYALSPSGIFRRSFDGTIWENIADGSRYSMGFANNMPTGFLADENGVFCVSYVNMSDSNTFAMKYEFDENAQLLAQKTVTIYSMWENAAIREAAVRYQKIHSDVRIEYVTAAESGSTATLSEKIRALNTQILSGNGADILVLDSLNAQNYIDKGVLRDLKDLFGPMIENNEINPKIAANYVGKKGRIYCMPAQYGVPIFIADKKMIDTEFTPSAVAELQKSLTDGTFTLSSNTFFYEKLMAAETKPDRSDNTDALFKMFVSGGADKLFDKDGNLDKAEFTKFITDIKYLNDSTRDSDYIVMPGINNNEFFDYLTFGDSSLIMAGCVHSATVCSKGLIDLGITAKYASTESFDYKGINNLFVPSTIVGINSSCKEPEYAEDFLKFLFGTEMQSVNLNEGYPVNTAALDIFIENSRKSDQGNSLSTSYNDANGVEHTLSAGMPNETACEKIKQILLAADKPIYTDITVEQLLWQEAREYFTGKVTAEQAAENAANVFKLHKYEDE